MKESKLSRAKVKKENKRPFSFETDAILSGTRRKVFTLLFRIRLRVADRWHGNDMQLCRSFSPLSLSVFYFYSNQLSLITSDRFERFVSNPRLMQNKVQSIPPIRSRAKCEYKTHTQITHINVFHLFSTNGRLGYVRYDNEVTLFQECFRAVKIDRLKEEEEKKNIEYQLINY